MGRRLPAQGVGAPFGDGDGSCGPSPRTGADAQAQRHGCGESCIERRPARNFVGFVSQSAGTQSLLLVQPNGEIVRQLEQPRDGLLVAPDWDKDGRLVAYTNNQFAEDGRMNCTVEMIDLATSELRVVAGPYSYCGAPSWSPSSDVLVFEADVDFQEPNLDIYLFELTSGEVSRLTTSSGNDLAPVWSHGGDKIAFSSASDANDGSSNLSVLELPSGKIWNDASISVAGPMAWGPGDGSIFLIGSAAPGVEIFEIDFLRVRAEH